MDDPMKKLEEWWATEGINLSHKDACIAAFKLGLSALQSSGEQAASPFNSRNPPADVVQSLRRFAAQNGLTVQVNYMERGCFHANLSTTSNMFDTVQLLKDGFVGSVFGQSPACGASDDTAKPNAEYDLACQLSGRQLLVNSFPRVELQVPDLLTCAIDSREILA